MKSIEISILKTIAYFYVFSHPLTQEEIIFFLDRPVALKEINPALDHLIQKGHLWQFDNFYSMRNDESIIARRVNCNAYAKTQIKKARRVATFLSWLPYIKGVAISGSLSKHIADENSDFDFFIITKANRLWIVRALYTVLFKIAAITRTKNWFCLNYFIDACDLQIKEHNLFTAVETATLIPLKGKKIFSDFFESNNWVNSYLPNYAADFTFIKDAAPVFFKTSIEWLMNITIANKLDYKLLYFFQKRFKKILAKNNTNEKGLTIGAFEATKHACKPLPLYFQPAILSAFLHRFYKAKKNYLDSVSMPQALLSK